MRAPFRAGLAVAALALLAGVANAGEAQSFVRGSWRAIMEHHRGQPIVVHFWGLTCGPCRQEMPAWGRLLAERPDVTLVTINADVVQNAPEAVWDFLDKSGLSRAENWIFDDSFTERLRYEIDPGWQGEIPVTLLIGPDGATRQLEGVAPMAEVRTWLDLARSKK